MALHVSVPPSGIELGTREHGNLCVVWANEYPDETGFEVSVRFEGGEIFTHTVPPDSHDFVFPSSERPILSGPACVMRRSFDVQVFVLRPSGKEPVGAVGMVAECEGPISGK